MRTLYTYFLNFTAFCFISILASATTFAQNSTPPSQLTDRTDVKEWIQRTQKELGLNSTYIEEALNQAKRQSSIEKIVTQSPNAKPPVKSWSQYQKTMIDPQRINKGITFWNKYQPIIQAAANEYGIPPEVIVAIIGIETLYGEYMGNYRVLDALSTLAFYYPPQNTKNRSDFFQNELAQFLKICADTGTKPTSIKGSYAGAIGYSQFMPSSIVAYAQDGNNNKRIDLIREPEDAIWSTARFLHMHGWHPGMPIYPPTLSIPKQQDLVPLVTNGIIPQHTWATLEAIGIREQSPTSASAPWKSEKIGVIDLPDTPKNSIDYRVVLSNFFVITHYNRSYFYASVVSDLAAILKDKKK